MLPFSSRLIFYPYFLSPPVYCFINTCFLFQSNSLSILSFSFSLILYQYFLSTSLSIISFSFSLLLYPYFLSHSVYFFINTTFLIQSFNLILYQNVRSLPVRILFIGCYSCCPDSLLWLKECNSYFFEK